MPHKRSSEKIVLNEQQKKDTNLKSDSDLSMIKEDEEFKLGAPTPFIRKTKVGKIKNNFAFNDENVLKRLPVKSEKSFLKDKVEFESQNGSLEKIPEDDVVEEEKKEEC